MRRFNKIVAAIALGLIAAISISVQAQPERYPEEIKEKLQRVVVEQHARRDISTARAR